MTGYYELSIVLLIMNNVTRGCVLLGNGYKIRWIINGSIILVKDGKQQLRVTVQQNRESTS